MKQYKKNIFYLESSNTSGGEMSDRILNHKILHGKRMNISDILLPLLKLLVQKPK